MTTLATPSFQRRLLSTVKDEVVAEPVRDWSQPSLELGLGLLRTFRASVAGMLQTLENMLSKGVEKRAFLREGARLLTEAMERTPLIQELVEALTPAEDAASLKLMAEVQALAEEEEAFRNLLTEALSRASMPFRPMDWDSLKREVDADFAAGRFVAVETADDVCKGMAGRN